MTQSPAGQGTAAPLSGDPGMSDKPRFAYGGQALMEGVYMRGKNAKPVESLEVIYDDA